MTTLTSEADRVAPKAKGLVVDDDEVWRRNFARYLSDAGLEPILASSLSEGQNLLDRQFFHVALVDLSLVGNENRDGLKVIQKIYQQLHEGTAGILLTAFGGVEEGAEAKVYGAFDVIGKQRISYPAVLMSIESGTAAASKALEQYEVGLNLLAGPGSGLDRQIHETNISMALGIGHPRADGLAKRLLKGLAPVLRHASRGQAAIDSTRKLVTGTYWSKTRGQSFDVRIGPATAVEDELTRFRNEPSRYAEGRYLQILRFEKLDNVAGVVFLSKEPTFEAFDPRPDPLLLPKR